MSAFASDAQPASAGLVERAAAAFAASVPGKPGDDGFFGPGSVTWRVSGDLSAPVAGLRALLLQALHPLAMAGVDAHSQWRADPVARLASTSAYIATVSFGDRAAASRAASRVRTIHEAVRGTDPVTGRPYAASDPELLLWVHNALVDSQLECVRLFGARLSAEDEDRYVAEMTVAAGLAGIPAGLAPASTRTLAAYFDAVRPELRCTPAAAESTAYLLEVLGADPEGAGIWPDIEAAAVASLPGWAIDLYSGALPAIPPGPEDSTGTADGQARVRSGSASEAAVTEDRRTAVRQALGVLDAVFIGEPGVLEARQRLALRMRRASGERQA